MSWNGCPQASKARVAGTEGCCKMLIRAALRKINLRRIWEDESGAVGVPKARDGGDLDLSSDSGERRTDSSSSLELAIAGFTERLRVWGGCPVSRGGTVGAKTQRENWGLEDGGPAWLRNG